MKWTIKKTLFIAGVLTISIPALAGQTNNPSEYVTDSLGAGHQAYIATSTGHTINENSPMSTCLTDGDIDSDGNWTPDSNYGCSWPISAAPFVAGIGPFQGYAQVLLQSSSTGQYFTDSSLDITMRWSAKIKYTWSGYSGCITPAFTLDVDTGSTYAFGGTNYTGTPYNTSDGSYMHSLEPSPCRR